ncbi:MAG: transcriptional regulator [Nocardioidaceae bacterium]|nr:transcriptional regulator [Nocardioidaceae bacterium]
MTPGRRWSCVVLALALLIGLPLIMRALPPRDSAIGASALLDRIDASRDSSYSGYVETLGTLQLPVTDRFVDVGELFGERTRMRVWWRDENAWRVDKILATGEVDLFHDGGGTTEWSYEQDRGKRTRDPDIRLPRTADLLPPELARRLIQEVSRDAVERIRVRRVAGVAAPGVRVRPGAAQSSIDHVDIWADPTSGLALRVDVIAKGDKTAALTSKFMTVSTETPDAETTIFRRPPGAEFVYDDTLDIADAANQYAPFRPPGSLAGLKRSPSAQRAVGIYGSGVTKLVAIPLWNKAAEPLREQLEATPGVQSVAEGDVLRVGPLGVLLTRIEGYGGGWLLTGTVTKSTLVRAARKLDARLAQYVVTVGPR